MNKTKKETCLSCDGRGYVEIPVLETDEPIELLTIVDYENFLEDLSRCYPEYFGPPTGEPCLNCGAVDHITMRCQGARVVICSNISKDKKWLTR